MINLTKSPTSAEFSVLVLITFLLKIDILGLAMLIQLDTDEDQVLQLICFFFFLHVMLYDSFLEVTEFFFAVLVIKQLTNDLLTVFVVFTWFYKIENVVIQQIEVGCGPHTSSNISLAIMKISVFFKTWYSYERFCKN